MGKNCRFRISDMMPNAWFYKLRDMGRRGSKNLYSAGRSQHQTPRLPATTPKLLPARRSFYYSSRADEAPAERSAISPSHHRRRTASDALCPAEPPRKSKKSARRKPAPNGAPAKPRPVAPSLSAACRGSVGEFPPPETPPRRRDYCVEHEHLASWARSCNCGRAASPAADIFLDASTSTSIGAPKSEKLDAAELNLRPILTKPAAREAELESEGVVGKERMKNQAKRSSAGLRRLRMRASSPRMLEKKAQGRRGRRSTSLSSSAAAEEEEAKEGVAASFAVVKASSDPQRDFRESMMEMIRENEITAAKDLEELLACYLSLNANEYHDVIVKVFEQIWFDLNFSCIKIVDY